MKLEVVPLDKIRPSPFQPRETFLKAEIRELAESIKGSGLVQPILVRKSGETFQIIAGERRWRAAQFAGIKEIPVLLKDAGDIESRELSLVENWHRLSLQGTETEKSIFELYVDGIKSGRYESVKDMARKTGISEGTLKEIITAHKERNELGFSVSSNLTYTDFRETRLVKNDPQLRRQILELREKGKLSRDDLREFSKTARDASESTKQAMFALRIEPEEARIIDAQLSSPQDKSNVIRMIEKERRSDRISSVVSIIKEINEMRKKMELVKEIDTGDIWLCPSCEKKFHLIHVDPLGSHRFEEVVE